MFMPPEYAWAEPVVIAAIIVFFVSWIGNGILFGNRLLNALMTAIVFGLIFGALAYFKIATLSIDVPNYRPTPAAAEAPAAEPSGPPANPVRTVPSN